MCGVEFADSQEKKSQSGVFTPCHSEPEEKGKMAELKQGQTFLSRHVALTHLNGRSMWFWLISRVYTSITLQEEMGDGEDGQFHSQEKGCRPSSGSNDIAAKLSGAFFMLMRDIRQRTVIDVVARTYKISDASRSSVVVYIIARDGRCEG